MAAVCWNTVSSYLMKLQNTAEQAMTAQWETSIPILILLSLSLCVLQTNTTIRLRGFMCPQKTEKTKNWKKKTCQQPYWILICCYVTIFVFASSATKPATFIESLHIVRPTCRQNDMPPPSCVCWFVTINHIHCKSTIDPSIQYTIDIN